MSSNEGVRRCMSGYIDQGKGLLLLELVIEDLKTPDLVYTDKYNKQGTRVRMDACQATVVRESLIINGVHMLSFY